MGKNSIHALDSTVRSFADQQGTLLDHDSSDCVPGQPAGKVLRGFASDIGNGVPTSAGLSESG